jgi:hypothetical protein
VRKLFGYFFLQKVSPERISFLPGFLLCPGFKEKIFYIKVQTREKADLLDRPLPGKSSVI